MNNLIIAALTFVMLPAFATKASAKNLKACRESKTNSEQIIVEKMNFTDDIINNVKSEDDITSVDVDYIVQENGKGYITYISGQSESAKNEVVKFIESATYNYNIVPGKVYSMKLTLKK